MIFILAFLSFYRFVLYNIYGKKKYKSIISLLKSLQCASALTSPRRMNFFQECGVYPLCKEFGNSPVVTRQPSLAHLSSAHFSSSRSMLLNSICKIQAYIPAMLEKQRVTTSPIEFRALSFRTIVFIFARFYDLISQLRLLVFGKRQQKEFSVFATVYSRATDLICYWSFHGSRILKFRQDRDKYWLWMPMNITVLITSSITTPLISSTYFGQRRCWLQYQEDNNCRPLKEVNQKQTITVSKLW